MRIGLIDNNQYSTFPPNNAIDAGLYIQAILAQELIKRDNEVTLYTPKLLNIFPKRQVPSRLHPFYEDFSLEEWSHANPWTKVSSLLTYDADLYLEMIEDVKKNTIDLLHIHQSPFTMPLPYLRNITIPKVITLHTTIDNLDVEMFQQFRLVYPALHNLHFVSISQFQVNGLPSTVLQPLTTIYHGLRLNEFPYNEKSADYIGFIGRFNRDKGPHIAIQVARKLKKKIQLRGRLSTGDARFFDKEIKPIIANDLVFLDTTVNRDILIKTYQNAKLLLFPIQWEEPFGLVMIEAMATGTPVVAFARGSVPEVIKDGETGFIVNPSPDDIRGNWIIRKTGIEGILDAVNRVYSLSPEDYKTMRSACRKHVEAHFAIKRMVDQYERVYKKMLKI